MLAIGVKEKEEKREREGEVKCLEDSSSTNTSQLKSSGVGKQASSRTLEAPSLAEAWKLRTSCCNNLAACHFQVIQSKVPLVPALASFTFSVGQSCQCC